MKKHLRRWGAVYILLLLFLGSWVGQGIAQAIEFAEEARTHREAVRWVEFWPEFWAATLENWQSEFLQLAVQCLIVQSLWANRHLFAAEGSASKDDIESLRAEIRALRNPGS